MEPLPTIYGKNNRIDHNHIVGKKNLGMTMIVGLDMGYGKKNKYKTAVSLYGVQVNDINNNIFRNTKALQMHLYLVHLG